MFAEQIRQAVMASPRVELPKVSSALWKAYAAGGVTEDEASDLSALIEARKAVRPPPKPLPFPRRVGSRPRTPASMARRRSWAASGRLPPTLAAKFTLAEQAVLAVVALAVEQSGGVCTFTLGHIAGLAGVCRTTARNALREAHWLGLIRVEERRLTAWRNAPNRVVIVSPEWLSWNRLRSKGGGVKSVPPTSTRVIRGRGGEARIGELSPRRSAERSGFRPLGRSSPS